MTDFDYDLFTIGAGSGGVRASRLAAQTGARVAVAEEDRPGGTCVLRGCVPKKLLVYASHFNEEFKTAEGFGWSLGPRRFDWPELIGKVQDDLTRLSGIYNRNLAGAGADLINDRAVIKDPHTVHLVNQNRDVTAKTILIATGSQPHLPGDVLGIEHASTSDDMFKLERLPEKIVIVGGGYIAVEFAGIMNGLGVDTTLLYRGAEILRGFDLDLRIMLHRDMERQGITIETETDVKCLEPRKGGGLTVITRFEREFEADVVLYATGRLPYTEGLGLENAGIELDERGGIKTDAYLKTACDSIYALGDVMSGGMDLTPIAIREGICFVETVFKNNPTTMDYENVPTAVFSQPPLGTVGKTELDMLKSGKPFDIYKTSFRTMKHGFADRPEHMLMKLLVDRETDKVLGAHLVGAEAGEMIQMLAIAVKMGATKAQVDATVAVHPTAAEELVTMREKYVPDDDMAVAARR